MKRTTKGVSAVAWFYGQSFAGRIMVLDDVPPPPCTHKGKDAATCHCLCEVCGLEDCRCCSICHRPDCEHEEEE